MKTEFLQNFKIDGQALPKEAIDAILAENGRDIEAAKKPFADYDHIKEQLKTAQDGLKAFDGVDVAKLQGEIATLQSQLTTKDTEWRAKLDKTNFEGEVKDAIAAAKGRNVKAIMALLDLETLQASKNRAADIKAAIDAQKTAEGYLFGDDTPAPYASGTGGTNISGKYDAETAKIMAAAGLDPNKD